MALITADGRDITHEEWRVIPEFPKYMITKDGDVKNRKTGYVLTESENEKSGAYYYSLWKQYKGKEKAYHRGFWSLVYDAFPELKPAPKWVVIEEFPTYKINQKGQIQNLKYEKIKIRNQDNVDYVMLRKEGEIVRRTIEELMTVTYPEVKEQEAA